ncbi:MAG: hypothetical protein Q8Q01_00965 [archaeon]|nr:hypothetical protein [archaeon]
MVETDLIVDSKELRYKGIFRADELFRIINKSLEEKGYTKNEKRSEEVVTEEGKRVFLELRPKKEVGPGASLLIKMRITLDSLTEKIEIVSGQKRNVNQGDVLIVFDGWLETTYEERYHRAPIRFFIKGLIDKYVYPILPERKYKGQVRGDIHFIESEILKSLKVFRQGEEESKKTSEDVVKKEVEEEVVKTKWD